MRIIFTGPKLVRRLVGDYEWSTATGFVQEVDAATAAELLTSPEGRFAPAPDEPLLALPGVGEQRIGELALAGIGHVDDLAALDDEGIRSLADKLWASAKQIEKWVGLTRDTKPIEEA